MTRSLLELSDRLSQDRVWRLKEISSVLKLSKSASLGVVEREFCLRAGAALFYAHWEGFVKRAATAYLEYIALQRPRVDQMADFLLCLFVQDRISNLYDRARVLEVAQMLLRSAEAQPKVNYKSAIDTESNLSSKVFKKVLIQIGLSTSPFDTKMNAIDTKILNNRHPIAHGAKGEIDTEELEEIGALVIGLCESFKDEIENAAVGRAFLRS